MEKDCKALLGDYFSEYDASETYFVDFLRDPPEATENDEEEISLEPPKIYEEIPRCFSISLHIYLLLSYTPDLFLALKQH